LTLRLKSLFRAKDMNETPRGKADDNVWISRVSTDGQTLAAQQAALRQAGVAKVYSETKSGASTDGRKALAQALRVLPEGDVLVVTRLDRLARSTRDLLNTLDWTPLAKLGLGLRALQINGATPPRHMGS
jgi:DNA invertase Pin-like site-specific DNA recombinase